MGHSTRRRWLASGLLLISWICAGGTTIATAQAQPGVNPLALNLADFKERVDAYAALRRKIEDSLPKFSNDSTPEEIDRHQRSFMSAIVAARASAKQGDVFTAPVRKTIRSLIAGTFARGNRETLRESIQDENVGAVRIRVNARYPDSVPLANMPAELLQNLPHLPEVLEYRFVGDTLILLDPGAHLIVDYVPNSLPPR